MQVNVGKFTGGGNSYQNDIKDFFILKVHEGSLYISKWYVRVSSTAID